MYKRIFFFTAFLLWVFLIVIGINLDIKTKFYDEIFIKKINISPIDKKKYNLNSPLIFPELHGSWIFPEKFQVSHKSFLRSFKDEFFFEKNEIELSFLFERGSKFVDNFKILKEIIKVDSFKKKECDINFESSFLTDKEIVMNVFSRKLELTNYCHLKANVALLISYNKLEKYYQSEHNRLYSQVEDYYIKRNKYFKLRNQYEELFYTFIDDFEKVNEQIINSLSKENKIIHKTEQKSFIFNYKFSILFLFLPVYLLLIFIYLPNQKNKDQI